MEEGLHEEAQALYLRVLQMENAKAMPTDGKQV